MSSQFSPEQIIEKRNRHLIGWVADHLDLKGVKREQLYSEMTVLFNHATENEQAEYLLEKLSPKKLLEDMESAKKVIKRFRDIPHGWLSNAADDRSNQWNPLMPITSELLSHMAANHPNDVAFTEQDQNLSFMQLKQLVDKISLELFEDSANIYGQHIENDISREIIALCADHIGVNTLVNISASISNEGLSAALKAGHIQVLYTDLMERIWETCNILGPHISLVIPIELFHRKIWKVKFHSDQSGTQIDEEEIKFRYHQWQESQPIQHPLSHSSR